ncbi:dihydroorotase [Candidatus Uhrbacteria bacterium]|nr:dihydroorotase [Candidatus Uhrbacteria bacterium]
MTSAFTIRAPDCFHAHLRNGDLLRAVLPSYVRQFARVLAMPNLRPREVRTTEDAERYGEEIRAALVACTQDTGILFTPLLTLFLTDATRPIDIELAHAAGVLAVKLYPLGVTTNSDAGVKDIFTLGPVLQEMERRGMVLCIHGEVPGIDPAYAEEAYAPTLIRIVEEFPTLRIVFEHISTAAMVACVESLPATVAATITAHHPRTQRSQVMNAQGVVIDPHLYCKPVAKLEHDCRAVRKKMTSGDSRFFFGSDSAPHPRAMKECAGCAAGVFSAPVAMETLVEMFEEDGCLERLEDFTSRFGAQFYGCTLNTGALECTRTAWVVPEDCGGVVPYRHGETLRWQTRRRS